MVKVFLPIKGKSEELANISSLDEIVINRHFGKSPLYALIDPSNGKFEILPNTTRKYGGSVSPPDFVKQSGGEVVIAAHMGQGAFDKLTAHGIKILRGDLRQPISQIVSQYNDGKLTEFSRPQSHNHDHTH